MQAVLEAAISPPSMHDRAIDAALDRIVCKALQRDAANRYSSALELEYDLESYLAKNAQPVTHSDVASWLAKLLPESRPHLRALVHAAKTTSLQPLDPRHASAPAGPAAPLSRLLLPAALATALLVLIVIGYWLLP